MYIHLLNEFALVTLITKAWYYYSKMHRVHGDNFNVDLFYYIKFSYLTGQIVKKNNQNQEYMYFNGSTTSSLRFILIKIEFCYSFYYVFVVLLFCLKQCQFVIYLPHSYLEKIHNKPCRCCCCCFQSCNQNTFFS